MLRQNHNCTDYFSVYSRCNNFHCFITERGKGSFLDTTEALSRFDEIKSELGINDGSLYLMNQVHSNKIQVVTSKSQNNPYVDALVTAEKNIYLGVRVADCVPVFFYDSKKEVAGVAHAGWKGTLGNITKRVIDTFIAFGSSTDDIYIAIGPHIGPCCYNVPLERANLFSETFSDSLVVSTRSGKTYLDIGRVNYIQLVHMGIKKNHIDIPPTCTSCQIDRFFSFRKDSKPTFGEMLGVIGMESIE